MARERTDLAWNRAGLAVVVAVAILLRRLWPIHDGGSVIALGLIAGGAVIWAIGLGMARRFTAGRYSGSREATLRMLTLGTLVLGAAGLAGALLQG